MEPSNVAKRGGENGRLTYRQRLSAASLTDDERNQVERLYRRQIQERVISWQSTVASIVAVKDE